MGVNDMNQFSAMVQQFDKMKSTDRAELEALAPDEAQAAVEQILHPRLWHVKDPQQLGWPGDLADSDLADDVEDS